MQSIRSIGLPDSSRSMQFLYCLVNVGSAAPAEFDKSNKKAVVKIFMVSVMSEVHKASMVRLYSLAKNQICFNCAGVIIIILF